MASLTHPTLVPEIISAPRQTLVSVFKKHRVVDGYITGKFEQWLLPAGSDAVESRESAIPRGVSLLAQSGTETEEVRASANGLVSMALTAYNTHHDLVLRPDDVWLAITTQFAYYVAANAERLRGKFVSHEGRKKVVIYDPETYGDMVAEFNDRIQDNVKDPTIIDWLIPSFSTTTPEDRMVAGIVTMATMKSYLSFTCCLMCGLPSVTLLGTVADWEQLLAKVEKLSDFDIDGRMTTWQTMLRPVLAEMVRTRKGEDNINWWQKIAHRIHRGSGGTFLSGWMAVFAVFTDQGKWQGNLPKRKTPCGQDEVSEYPEIEMEDLPSGIVTCPLTLNDNGVERSLRMFAGSFCYTTETGKDIRPRSDWCIAVERTE